MRRLLVLLVLLVGCATLAAAARTASHGRFTATATVTRVVDGDTVDVRLSGGRADRIRFIGIDTPEVGQCLAAQATAHARTLALGRRVVLRGDATQATRDRYGRLLAYMSLPGGRDFGYEQIAAGLARVYVYDRPFQRLASYRRAEQIGRTRPQNVWKGCGAPAPATNRCDPSYPDVCIPPPPPDLDCADVPYRNFRVVGADPHGFDGDGDGYGCER
jgi:micrococcal nuclease